MAKITTPPSFAHLYCYPRKRDDGTTQIHCVYVPIIPPLVPVGPLEGKHVLHLNPWILVEGRTPDWAKDLQILASMEVLARELGPNLGMEMREGFQRAVARIRAQLPEGAELHFGEY
jgi:hypothetical protein